MLELIGLFVVRVLVKLSLMTAWLGSLFMEEKSDTMQGVLSDIRQPTGERHEKD